MRLNIRLVLAGLISISMAVAGAAEEELGADVLGLWRTTRLTFQVDDAHGRGSEVTFKILSEGIMKTAWLTISVVLMLSSGCASTHIRPDSAINRSFDAVDLLRVKSSSLGESFDITDPETISRLKAIHARSKWDPTPTTMPVDMISIHGFENGEQRFKLVYGAGLLMDTDDGEIVRLGTLNEEDREWMDSEFRSRIPLPPGIL